MCKKMYVVIGRFHGSIAGFFVVDETNWINIDGITRIRMVDRFKEYLMEWSGFSSVVEYVKCYPGEYAKDSLLVTSEGSVYDHQNFLNVYAFDDAKTSFGNVASSLIGDERNFIVMYPTVRNVKLAAVAAKLWYTEKLNPWWCIDGSEVS